MGRKCSTHFNGVSCDSGHPGSTFQGSIFTFPSTKTEKGRNECTKWLQALPNYIDINNVTQWMGICEKHWKPGYEFKHVQGGAKKPIHPPTEFGDTPRSLHRQTVKPSHSRKSESRNVLLEERSKIYADKEQEKDRIKSWNSLVTYCKSFDLTVFHNDDYIRLCKLSEQTFPPKIDFSIQIKKCFNVQAYRGSTNIPLSDILNGF